MPHSTKYGLLAGISGLLIFGAACAKKPVAATPPPPPHTMAMARTPAPAPNWGHAEKTAGCAVTGSLQDQGCTPGDIIKANTKQVICSADFRTGDIRDSVTSPTEKAKVYDMYNIPHPTNNSGKNQKCEIDHLVSLELGGNDTMANLWPQCSPGYAGWTGAGFRDKDKFENYLHRQVCAGAVTLAEAQRQIATDWYQYWISAGKPKK